MVTLKSELINEWNYSKNLDPNLYTTRESAWWICSYDRSHEWKANINNRLRGTKCPYCTRRKVSDLNKIVDEKMLLEWDHGKNKINIDSVPRYSSKYIWWKCHKEHSWQSPVYQRSNGQGCPYCAGLRATPEHNLETLFPDLAKELSIKNNINAIDLLPFSGKKILWVCKKCNFEWLARVSDRTLNHSGCHHCSGYNLQKKCTYSDDGTKKTCNSCDVLYNLSEFRVRRQKNGNWVNSICKKCESDKVSKYRVMTKKGIVAEIFRRKKSYCKKNNIPFNLTKEWILSRLEEIEWKCELTGMPMKTLKTDIKNKSCGFTLDSISLDRINPNAGYVKSNVRFVLNQVNMFKHTGTDKKMYEVAEALIKFRDSKKVVL